MMGIVLDPSLEERKLFCFYGDSDALVQVTVHFRYSSIMHGRTRESKRFKRWFIFYTRTHGDRKKKSLHSLAI